MSDPSTSDPYRDILLAEDPAPIVHRLRAEDPVHWVEGLGFWFVTRHDDVKRLYHDPQNVTPDRRVWERFEPRPEGSMLRWVDDAGLMAVPPEAHTRIRRLVASAFTPRAVRRMEGQIHEVVERFAEPLRGRPGEVLDLLNDLTNPIPNAVISRLTGVPPAGDDEARFRELAQSIIRAFFPFTTGDAVREAEAGFRELAAWVREMALERRDEPREDLVSDLVRARDRDERLTDDEIVLLLTGILGAGSETTALGGPAGVPRYAVRDDLRRFQDLGLYKRPLNFPVEIADALR